MELARRKRKEELAVLEAATAKRKDAETNTSAWTASQARSLITLVPIRPRRRGERRFSRTFPGASLRPALAFNPDNHRRLSTPSDAFQLHPDIDSYKTTLRRGRR